LTHKPFALYLGGRAPRANPELHDMVFATGTGIEDCYEQILEKWFGTPGDVHIDSWLELDIVDGWRVNLSRTAPAPGLKLFFVNLGAYRDGEFTEAHAVGFYVATDALEAKKRALAELFKTGFTERHKDDLLDIDDCIIIDGVNGFWVTLTRTNAVSDLKPNSAYHAI